MVGPYHFWSRLITPLVEVITPEFLHHPYTISKKCDAVILSCPPRGLVASPPLGWTAPLVLVILKSPLQDWGCGAFMGSLCSGLISWIIPPVVTIKSRIHFWSSMGECCKHVCLQGVAELQKPVPWPSLQWRSGAEVLVTSWQWWSWRLLGNTRGYRHTTTSLRCCKYLHAAGSLSGRKSSSLCQCTRPRPNASIRKLPASEIECLRFCTQHLQIESNSHLHRPPKNWKPNFAGPADLVGGFNPIEKY